jgi:hypothetical protein
MIGDIGLDEDRTPIGIESDGQEGDREVEDPPGEILRGVFPHDGVLVHDAEEAIVDRLELDPLSECTEVIPQVSLAARLHPAENALPHDPLRDLWLWARRAVIGSLPPWLAAR